MGLGHWAIIDIETTGINPGTDEIIDLGYLKFEDTKLVKTFSSLVRPKHPVSAYITKLTGISNEMLSKAPLWTLVEVDLLELETHQLLAHNSQFEQSFLARYFDQLPLGHNETYHDSILYLALLFPESHTLNLESFIIKLGIANKEEHRGLADSIDLLKTLLLGTYLVHLDREFYLKLKGIFETFPEDFFYKKFFLLSEDDLKILAEQIEFDLDFYVKKYQSQKINPTKTQASSSSFSLSFTGENIQSILKDESAVQNILPGYRYRQAQEKLALKVGQAFRNSVHSLIQAPTGTGKTMGYLLPSILFGLDKKESCLIATGTKTLQEQAMNKDVPQVLSLIGQNQEVKVVKLIGSKNHLCELLFRESLESAPLLSRWEEEFVNAYFEVIFYYNSKVSYENKITREQIPYVLKKLLPSLNTGEIQFAVDYKSCAGHNCPFSKDCSYLSGLREAKEANLIVGNHSLMLNWPRAFDRPKYIIVDEAHRIEHEATTAYTVEVSKMQLESFGKNFMQGMGALFYLISSQEDIIGAEDVIQNLRETTQLNLSIFKDHSEPLEGLIEAWFKKLPNFSTIYSNELRFPQKNELKDPLAATLYNHFESLNFIVGSLYQAYFPFANRWQVKDFQGDLKKIKAWSIFENHFTQLEALVEAFKLYLATPSDWSSVIKFSNSESFHLLSSPIDIGQKIHDELLSQSSSVIFTSATLANERGDAGVLGVEWMTGYSYLNPEKRFKSGLFLEATFDYKNKAKVFLSSDTRNLNDSLFVPELLAEIIPLINKIGGRTLLLFSSRMRFETAGDLLLRAFEGKIPVFIQGLGKQVIEDFKQSETGILIGMESFGEGIDIPGDKLSFIVIDKIPDVRQDIIIQKRREFFESKFGNEFNDYFLSHRARSLHQKFGRLLRSETDRGVILVVDNRIRNWKGNTLKTFQRLLEPYEINSLNLKDAIASIGDYFGV